MTNKIKVILCGLGAIGREMALLIQEKKNLEVVAAIDISEEMAGKDLGRVIGLDRDLGITVSSNASETFRSVQADIVLDAENKFLEEFFPTVKEALENGKNILSIGDESGYPWDQYPDQARQIDEAAKRNGVTFLGGAGINPGFMQDYLPIALAGTLKRVDKFTMRRVIDVVRCGRLTWEACGLGQTVEAFNEKLAKGTIRANGAFKQIMQLIARALSWGKLDGYSESFRPIISKSRRVGKFGVVEPGTICGIDQMTHGSIQGKEVFTCQEFLCVSPNLEEDGIEPIQFISIEGVPSIELTITGGQVTDQTVAHVVNSIPVAIAARPGLVTVDELPPATCLP